MIRVQGFEGSRVQVKCNKNQGPRGHRAQVKGLKQLWEKEKARANLHLDIQTLQLPKIIYPDLKKENVGKFPKNLKQLLNQFQDETIIKKIMIPISRATAEATNDMMKARLTIIRT